MINKEQISKALSSIKTSEELDKKILDATIYKQENKNIFSKKGIIAILILVVFMTTTVFAKDFIYNCILNLINSNDLEYTESISLTNPVNIKNTSDISCDNFSTLSEVETTLGIKFIFDTSKYNEKISKCAIKINNQGYLESLELSILEFYDYSLANKDIDLKLEDNFTQEEYMAWLAKRKMVDLHIAFMTQYASYETKNKFKNYNIIYSTGGYLEAQEFIANNINTTGYYFLSPSKNIPLRKELVFVNNNILYEFSANKPVEIEELLNIINEF